MMKSFFKKLAFVMALAMVVSMVAPAAQTAVAAEEKKPLAIAYQKGAVITALNLAEIGDTEDLRFVYAPENWKELEVKWSSSNENVVSVNDSGIVNAEAAGTATISVAVGTETASIEVYSVDTTTFTATMGDAEDRERTELTLTVGDEFDFAFYGIKDYSVDRYRCEWFAVDPEGVLEFDDTNGKLVAKKAGSAKISLLVGNYVTGIKTEVAPCTVIVKDVEPEVDPNNFEVTKMISDSKFELTFENTEVKDEDIKNNLKVYYYATGDVRVNYNSVKSISVKDGVATVEFYYTVGDGVKYVFAMNGIEKEFTTYIGKPASMYFTLADEKTGTKNVAWAGYTTLFEAHILNDKGTEITNSVKNSSLGKVIEYTLVDAPATAQYWLNGDGIYFADVNVTAVVKATFWDGYDNTGVRIAAAECTAPVTSTEKPLYDFPYQTPVAATVHGNWDNNVNTKFAVGDDTAENVYEGTDGNEEYFWVKLKDSNGETVEIHGNGDLTKMSENRQLGIVIGQFSFMSDNMNIFTIGVNGEVKANAAGTANILVYYDPNINNYTDSDKHLVAVVPVTCYGTRYVANVAIDKNFDTISTYAGNNNNGFNKATFKVTLTDQVGDKIDAIKAFSFEPLPTQGTTLLPVVNATGLTKTGRGEYTITVECTDEGSLGDGATRQLSYAVKYDYATKQTFSVNIVNPITENTNIDASSYYVDLSTSHWKKDLNTAETTNLTLTTKLIAKRSGVNYQQYQFAGLVSDIYANNKTIADAQINQYYVKIVKDGVDVTSAKVNNVIANQNNGWTVVTTLSEATRQVSIASGQAIVTVVDKNLGAGNYTVAVYKAVSFNQAASPSALSLVAQNSITIADSQPKVTSITKKAHLVSGATDAYEIAKKAFEVKIGDKTLKYGEAGEDWKNTKVDANYTKINANTYFYHTITVYVPSNGVDGNSQLYVPYTITVNDYVSIP